MSSVRVKAPFGYVEIFEENSCITSIEFSRNRTAQNRKVPNSPVLAAAMSLKQRTGTRINGNRL